MPPVVDAISSKVAGNGLIQYRSYSQGVNLRFGVELPQ